MRSGETPLIRALQEYISGDPAYFRIPAHRFSRGVSAPLLELLGEKVFCADLTEAEGLDDLHAASGAIAEAQKLAAELWGSEESFFLVNGSTCGNEAMLLSCLRPGDKVLLARNVHKSVLMGLVLSGAEPVWMQPEHIPGWEIDGRITPETVARHLDAVPDCRAVMLVSPTYYGICSPLKEIAGICHERNIPLLVDEAHGSHLYFMNQAPCGAVQAGADLTVQSIHKTGGSMTQSSLLHIQGNRVDRTKLKESLAMVMSTSPSYVLMASLDGARQQLEVSGKDLMQKAAVLAEKCRGGLKQIPGIDVLEDASSDPLRIVFNAAAYGIAGTELQDILYRDGGISLELSDPVSAVAVITWGNTDEDIERLLCAVRRTAEQAAGQKKRNITEQTEPGTNRLFGITPRVVCTPREAWYSEKTVCSLEDACGKTAGESIIPYPPGIPVLYPGEEITEEILKCVTGLRDGHVSLHGPEDSSLRTVRILQQSDL